MAKTPQTDLQSYKKQLDLLINAKGVDDAVSSFGKLAQTLKKILLPPAFVKGLDLLIKYNKEVLRSSVLIRGFGVSLATLEKSLEGVRKATHLTRVETVGLFAQYQSSTLFSSLKNFNQLMGNMEKAFGANSEAMKGFMGIMVELSSLFPTLHASLSEIDKVMNKEALVAQLNLLYSIGALTTEKYRELLGYASDDASTKTARDNVAAMAELKRTLEDISIGLGQVLLPLLKMIAGALSTINNIAGGLGGKIATIAGSAFLAYKAFNAIGLSGAAVAAGGGMGGVLGSAARGIGTAAKGLGVTTAIAVGGNMLGGYLQDKGEETGSRATSVTGSTISGASTGAGIGAAVGSFIPVIGTTLGGLIGAAAGGIVGLVQGLTDSKNITNELVEETQRLADEDKRRERIITLINSTLTAQTGLLSAVAEQAKVIGNLSQEELKRIYENIRINTEYTLSLIPQRLARQKELLRQSELAGDSAEQIQAVSASITQTLTQEVQLRTKLSQLALVSAQAYEGQLNVAKEQRTLLTNMVSLMDNYAVGVGASVAARRAAVDAETEMQRILQLQIDELASKAEFQRGDLLHQQEMLGYQNQMLSSMQSQAGLLKSLRDGWISAIAAMNTGAGRFTKIVFDQTASVGAAIRTGMAVQSFTTGGIGGYNTSEQISSLGNITSGQGAFGGHRTRMPYETVTGNTVPWAVGAPRDRAYQSAVAALSASNARVGTPGAALGVTNPLHRSELLGTNAANAIWIRNADATRNTEDDATFDWGTGGIPGGTF